MGSKKDDWIQSDDYQWRLKIEDGVYRLIGENWLGAVKNGEEYEAFTGIVNLSEWNEEERAEVIETYYGSIKNFELACPKLTDREDLLAEMIFETYPHEIKYGEKSFTYRETDRSEVWGLKNLLNKLGLNNSSYQGEHVEKSASLAAESKEMRDASQALGNDGKKVPDIEQER